MTKDEISKLREFDTFVTALYSVCSGNKDKDSTEFVRSFAEEHLPALRLRESSDAMLRNLCQPLLNKYTLGELLSNLGFDVYVSTDDSVQCLYVDGMPLIGMHYVISAPVANIDYYKLIYRRKGI